MGHLPKLIEDLALILIVGAVVTLVFKWIRQPVVLGYILAGLLVGPHTSLIPTIADQENVETLAEIGVIFLLFSLGLEFSFKKLVRVGGAASITAFVEIIFITLAGYITGKLLGWSTMDSLFLGGMLASSSTTIIIRAFDELGVKTKQFAGIVFGVLVVEDIVVILLMVLLSTVAVAQQFAGTELIQTIIKLLFFLILWFIAGIFLIPTFLKRVREYLNDETLLILSIGLCLGMVVLATQVGFSAELGAFIMGSILAESTKAEKVEHVIKPVKDLFGAIFFVSVGMMIDPVLIMEHKWSVLVVTLLTILGKMLSTTGGAIISGQPLKQSIQVGMSMAQIGEFAFIVATLGMSLGVISDFLFPVAVGASAITTFTTPYMINYSGRLYSLIERVTPSRWIHAINNYSAGMQNIQGTSSWKPVVRAYLILMISNGIIVLGLMLLSFRFIHPFLLDMISPPILANAVTLVVILGLGMPFLWGLMIKRPTSLSDKSILKGDPNYKRPLLSMEIIRSLLGIVLTGFLIDSIFNTLVALLVGVPLIILLLKFFSAKLQHSYQMLENRFISNLNERETEAEKKRGGSEQHKKLISEFNLQPWDAHIVDLEVSPHADYIGKSLEELAWREEYGINIGYIRRGEKLIYAPARNTKLFPFDQVGIIATDEQLQNFVKTFNPAPKHEDTEANVEDIVIQNILITENNPLRGLNIRESGIRERTEGLIIGIERNNVRILNPVSNMIFESGDIVWIVGDKKKILTLSSE